MKKSTSLLALVAASALALSGCANDADEKDNDAPATNAEETTASEDADGDTDSEDAEGEEPEAGPARDYTAIDGSDYKACLVSDQGGWDDKSFNESAYNGLVEAGESMKVDTQTAESTDESDFQPNVDTMVAEDCDIIIGVGFMLQDAIQKAADVNPDIKFGLVDSGFADADHNPITIDNGRPLLFNTAEAAYLAGYVAAGTTETGIVATFGGMPIPSVQVFMDGFADGVDAYNEAHGESVTLLGWDKAEQKGSFTQSFEDQAKGQQITDGFISQGADIIMPVAGPVGLGAASAVKSADGVKIIGVDSDWYESAPEFSSIVLTSVIKDIDVSILEVIADLIEGDFTSDAFVGTLENGGVDLAPFHDFEDDVDPDLVKEVNDLKAKIISGELKVESPNTPK